jgi:LysR family transcriptional activator of mexEF-oprN operon
VRQGRGLALTSRGADLVAVARAHLGPLVAAVTHEPVFDARTSAATVRIGLSDAMEGWLLPPLLARVRKEAPSMQLVVLPVQFRSVEETLVSGKVDLAVTVADDLPPSILRKDLRHGGFVVLHDPRHSKIRASLRERDYFAGEHVIVSYAGDVRGVVEDALGKARKVKVSLSSFAYVADVVQGTSLLATVPRIIAEHVLRTHPKLRTCPLPFALPGSSMELLWSKVKDEDGPSRFVRELVESVATSTPG